MAPSLPEPFRSMDRNCREELRALRGYPENRFADIIQEVGFSCDRCARCCTRAFNGNVQLLDDDADRIGRRDPAAYEPAFPYDFCDRNGTFYVSGYTIASRGDAAGSCLFLDEGRCRIYDERPVICRIYPFMLHREPDTEGTTDWRQISGLDEHGCYHTVVPRAEAVRIARETRAWEEALLCHELAFLGFIGHYFARNGLRHVRKVYDDRMRDYTEGAGIRVMVYFCGRLEPWEVRAGRARRLTE
ncbi:MAG: YkgJ family cysteine cluster protein [Methanomicrobiales archaeon]|nr:YkgJ family cysteine cluster protein [Methanomicrobiales archaeon]